MKAAARHSLKNFTIFLLALVVTALLLGFVAFTIYVSNLRPMTPPNADGIVVWTGKGGDRVDAGAKLLQNGHGERLLISGTNAALSRDTILEVIQIDDKLKACCVDLDQAKDTIDNAIETANWTKALGYEHIILVTSAYHMPRAEIEIGNVMGRVKITAHPVRDPNTKPWWKSSQQFKRLMQEYAKFIISVIRNNNRRGVPPALQ